MTVELEVLRVWEGKRERILDSVSEEGILTVYLGDEELVSMLCTPRHIKELSVGFLFSSGIIHSASEIKRHTINEKSSTVHLELIHPQRITYTSGCGKGVLLDVEMKPAERIQSSMRILARKILYLMHEFQNKSSEFQRTGSVHSACFSDGEGILIFHEDIGRHNAIDKVIGEALITGLDMTEAILLTTGRISTDIVHKVLRTRAPIICSRSAPTYAAVQLCREKNMTLIGFARGKRMNLYSGQERIGQE
jgi:FdhD protein